MTAVGSVAIGQENIINAESESFHSSLAVYGLSESTRPLAPLREREGRKSVQEQVRFHPSPRKKSRASHGRRAK